MRSTTRSAVTAITTVAVVLLAGAAASGHPSTPTRVTTIVGDAPSTQPALVDVLAGSADRLVYSSTAELTTAATSGEINEGPDPQIIVRSANGSQYLLTGLRGGPPYYTDFSLSGQTLTALRIDPGGHVNNRRLIDWWNLASRHHGVSRLPRHTDYLTAAPNGVAYINRHGVVLEAMTGGSTKRLGKPFSSEPRGYFENNDPDATGFAAADDRGIVMGDDDGHARYIAFADPGTVVDLATDGSHLQGCQAVNHQYAACIGSTGAEADLPSITITPLDGKQATTFAGPDPFDAEVTGSGIALSGSTVLWTHLRPLPSGDTIDWLVSMSAGDPTPTVGSDQVAELHVTSAYGEAVTESPDYTALISATTADATSILLASPRSPASASAFSLSPGRLANVDDALEPATAGPVAVRLRTRATIEGQASTGAPTTIASPSDASTGLVADRVATSPTATAYISTTNGNVDTVHVVDESGDEVIGTTLSAGVLALSGNRLLYVGPGSDHQSELTVRDLVTGTDTMVAERIDPDYAAAAIYGHSVSYMTDNGSVFQTNLKTGTNIRLAKRTTAGPVSNLRVYAYGDWVGWSYRASNGVRTHEVNMLLNVTAHKSPIHLGQSLVGIGPDGALLADDAAALPDDDSSLFVGSPAVISLHTWSGHTGVIASRRSYIGVPQLVGNTLAWINGKGDLQAAAVKAPEVDPNFVGDANAPTTYTTSDPAGWRLAAPYSLPLTTCSVSIADAGGVVRTLECDGAISQGLATVLWDGRINGGEVAPAGVYRWTIHAAGADGAAHLESGAPGNVTGTVTSLDLRCQHGRDTAG